MERAMAVCISVREIIHSSGHSQANLLYLLALANVARVEILPEFWRHELTPWQDLSRRMLVS